VHIEQALLGALKAEQADYALQALRKPNQRDAFEYGYRVGVLAGLDRAVEILLKLLDEDKNGNPDL
jgi:hypothetical protein